MNQPTTAPTESDPRRIVRCANCSAENIVGATRCRECDTHLYVVCRHCGRSNARALRNCAGCEKRLGGSLWKRRFRRIFRRVDPVTVIVGVIVLLVMLLLLLNHQRSSVPPQTDQPTVSE